MNEKTPKTRQQMAQEIGVSYSTFWRWLQKNKIQLPRGLIYPIEQEKIYKKLYSKEMKDIERK
jgi:predicted site-specific integrase-resolvase